MIILYEQSVFLESGFPQKENVNENSPYAGADPAENLTVAALFSTKT